MQNRKPISENIFSRHFATGAQGDQLECYLQITLEGPIFEKKLFFFGIIISPTKDRQSNTH